MHAEKKTPTLGGAWAARRFFADQLTVESKLADSILAHTGLAVSINPDGEIHRHDHPDGRKGNKRIWYVCHSDYAVHGDWAAGDQHAVFADDNPDPATAHKARQQAQERRQAYLAEKARGYALVAKRTRTEWLSLPLANPAHPYLAKKSVQPHRLRQKGDLLVVPLTDGQRLVNWQTIAADGSKRFQPGGQVKGCYHPIGEIRTDQPLLIAEGWATAATLHEATGYAVAAAMNCGNLHPVAINLRERYPSAAIIVCADNDHRTPVNPGVTAGNHAAIAVGGRCVWPPAIDGVSDFNDLAAMGGEVAL